MQFSLETLLPVGNRPINPRPSLLHLCYGSITGEVIDHAHGEKVFGLNVGRRLRQLCLPFMKSKMCRPSEYGDDEPLHV